ncbi:MAG: hypothetical protein IPK77_07585 [Cellvibrio sp.]|nr:hypothetical protein [Cellvibrio sp.]
MFTDEYRDEATLFELALDDFSELADELFELELIVEFLENELSELEAEVVASELLLILDCIWLDGALERGVKDRGCSAIVSFLSLEAPQADKTRAHKIIENRIFTPRFIFIFYALFIE